MAFQDEHNSLKQKQFTKECPFKMFDNMVKEKYGIKENQFEEMTRKERNRYLMKMMESQNNIVIFPKVG